MNKKIPIIVKRGLTVATTGLNNIDNPGPGIPFIRGVLDSKEFNTKIIGLAYENLEPGICLEVADQEIDRAPRRFQCLKHRQVKKGAHLQVEGELRSREQTSKKTNAKQRVWEVRVSSILKLDRAEKVNPEEQENADFNPEEEAA